MMVRRIGIGRLIAEPPSHITRLTDHVPGDSADLAGESHGIRLTVFLYVDPRVRLRLPFASVRLGLDFLQWIRHTYPP